MSDKYPGGFVTANAPAGFSVAFDGTGDWLSVGSSNQVLPTGTQDFSVEMWVYVIGYTGSYPKFAVNPVTNGFNFYRDTTTSTLNLGRYNVDTPLTASWSTSYNNAWTHICVTRSSSAFRMFINGVLQGYNSSSPSYAAITAQQFMGESGQSFQGYASNIRTVLGSIPTQYQTSSTTTGTTIFVPPTQLLPVGASLLTAQSPTIIDNSTNNFTITANGDAKVSNFTPFAAYQGFNPALGAAAGGVWTLDEAAYYQNNRQWPIYDPYFNNTTLMLHGNGTNAAQNNTFLDSSTNNFTITRNGNTTQGSFSPFSQTGWSNYFSTSPFLTVASNTAFDFGSGDATQEMWIYPTTASQTGGLFDKRSIGANYSQFPQITIESGVLKVYVSYTGSSWAVQITGATPTPNAWTHIALVRYGNTWTLYVNGVVSGTPVVASGSVYASTNNLCIGASATDGSNPYTGYISNVRIVKGTALYTSNFTPSTAPLTAATGTSLLTCQSNRFVDNSANNFSITLNSTVSVQAFSPFVPAYITPTTYSNWFDGSGDYLTSPSSAAYQFDSGDFTVESWIYFNSVGNAQFASIPVVGALYWQYYAGVLDFGNNAGGSVQASWTPVAGRWYHVASVRNGATLTHYINGVVLGSGSAFNVTATGTLQIGYGGAGTFNGLFSNFRMVKGTAVYTAAFTPPTAPLTAISGTSLLTCQSSTLIDNSTNNFTLTAYGNIQPVTSPTPFPAKVDTTTLNSAYSTSLIGGSGYFDGSSDYLTAPSSANLDLSTGDFTFEVWLRPYSIFDSGGLGNGVISAGGKAIALDFRDNTAFFYDGAVIIRSAALKLYSWNHLALVRSSGVAKFFVNGVLGSTASYTSSLSFSSCFIGSQTSGGGWYQGEFSGMRLVKGTALYNYSFAPPIEPPTAVANTQLLLNFTNGAIFDNTAKNVVETVNGAAISTTQSKYGGSSIYLDGNSPYSYLKGNANLAQNIAAFGSGDFTVECWVYLTTTATDSTIIDTRPGTNAGSYYLFYVHSNQIAWYVPASGYLLSTSTTFTANTWTHIAVTRSGGTIRSFFNGVLQQSATDSNVYANPGAPYPYIGASYSVASDSFHGYIDDLRITKGVARYTTNFTPPTSQLQDQ